MSPRPSGKPRAFAAALLTCAILLAGAQTFAIEPPTADVPAREAITWRGPDGSSALHYAVYEQDAERVAALLDAGADPNLSNRYGANPMQLAAEVGDAAILDLLLRAGADVDSPNPEGQTALMLVARTGNVAAAKLLVDHGATLEARESWGEQNALMWAAARRHPDMVAYLLDRGADPDTQSIDRDYRRHLTKEGRAKSLDRGGFTPLLYAVRENCAACVQTLTDHHADLDKPDPDGVSPLLLAVLDNHWDLARQLIDAGADVQQWDIFGQTPLLAAVNQRKASGLNPNQTLNDATGLDIVTLLLERGADPNAQLFFRPAKQRGPAFSRGTTPLIAAAGNGDVDVIKLLLAHGARANLPQADRQTPVSVLAGASAPQAALVEGLKLLVAAGAELDILAVPHHLQRTRGGTPLHYAVDADHDQVVQGLAELGADLNQPDVDGLTALDHAMARNQVPFLRMRQPVNTKLAEQLRALGATNELDVVPFWPNVGPPFYYPWSIFPLDPAAEAQALVPGSFDHQ